MAFKTANAEQITLDIISPEKTNGVDQDVALVHFHGGFLVVGDKQTFPPNWLISACERRGWHYISPSYRLLPEATGEDAANDAKTAVRWVHQHLARRIIIAGSSAGGYLALLAAAQLRSIRPVAVLSIYGINSPASADYTTLGSTLMGAPPMANLEKVVQDLKAAAEKGEPISGYPFPEDKNDRRMGWIAALHEATIYPDIICGVPGLSKSIRMDGVQIIPKEVRQFFPLDFGLDAGFPPTAFLHGDQDSCVNVAQSVQAAEKLRNAKIKVLLEVVAGKDHGFDAMEVAPGVNVEAEGESGDISVHLKSILRFLDEAVDQ
ncbi:hypothetical protein G7Z17_g277 [Cylindrodendrum hubeiense]|uniref:Alpha/beta hydrolase fold-3 domain-containing protein n=1 Tax=Cylindrodendrum hubeiense TaxID=595255 RepID=A0A9P5LDG3_9HYPO|nr:hypothetical protein G7Z17_g277 [Cylindrodendrum hubeiense]